MTAEFDSSRFTVVDKFFGNETEPTKIHKKSTGSSTADSKVGRRVGVGISANNKNVNETVNRQSHNDLARQVLSVGRKRFRDNSAEDTSKEFDGDGFDIHGSHDADEMVDGRTSLKTNHKKEIEDRIKNTKPKKKLGKKERERQKHGVSVERVEVDAKQSGEISITDNSTGDHTKGTGPAKTNGKRKRRKVRSRQKNIRKDNRAVNEKPTHLIPGNRNYQGRPMTQATREKLGLPENRDRGKSNEITSHGSSLFVIDRGQDCSGDDPGAKLAIDEFLNDAETENFVKSESLENIRPNKANSTEKSNSSKKKKRRFKNLV